MRVTNFTKQLFSSLILILLSTFISNAQDWYKANEPFGGNILSIHEAGDGTLLCGTTLGLYKSTDNGENWESISGEAANWPVLSVNSTSSGMYLALFYYTLKRSYDGGQTWETIPAVDWDALDEIVVNDDDEIFLNTTNEVWRSSDEGDTWTHLSINVPGNKFGTLKLSPDGEFYGSSYNHKIYRSSDNGDTWTELFTADGDISSIAFDGDNTVYMGTRFSGLFKSSDNGDNWSPITAIPGTNGALDMNVNSSGDVFVAGYDDGLYKSANGGSTWEDITYDLVDPTIRQIFLNADDELFAATTAAGVQMFEGTAWTPKNQGISAIYILRFISIDGVLYACSDYGVHVSDDGGQSWQQSVKGMDDTEIVALAKAPNGDLYAGSEMLYRSEDGINWTDISQAFPDGDVYTTDLLIEPDGRIIMATDEYGICYSDNQGQTWTFVNSGLEDVTMAFIRKNQAGYYFTADGYNLYRTNDLDGGWEIINNGITDTDIVEFTAGNGALFAITYSDGLFRSADNGNTWSLAMDNVDFNNVAVNGSEVYCSSEYVTGGGVYFSDDNGLNWENIADGLPNMQVEEVNYVEDLGLFASVRDYGLYTLDFSVTGLDEPLYNESQLSCYPNPFTESATLKLELEENSYVSFQILNLRGQIVERSSPEFFTKGTYNFPVGKNLPNGAYLVTTQINNSSNTVRLIKTK